MDDQHVTAFQQDTVLRAINADPTSALYGPGFREAHRTEYVWEDNPAADEPYGSSVLFLLGCCVFVCLSLFFW